MSKEYGVGIKTSRPSFKSLYQVAKNTKVRPNFWQKIEAKYYVLKNAFN